LVKQFCEGLIELIDRGLFNLIIVINDGGKISLKMNLVIQMFLPTCEGDSFYVFRKSSSRFEEKWTNNQVDLANTFSGNLAHILLMLIKNPRELHNGLLRRLYRQKNPNIFLTKGFLSVLSQALGEYFEKPAKQNNLLNFFEKNSSPKIFLVDEFLSIRLVNLQILKNLGSIIYVSQDIAKDRYGVGENAITKTLMYKLEHDALKLADLVVACSERDRIKYLEMGARKVVFYPNAYPIEFETSDKDEQPSISIILGKHWGYRVEESLQEALKAISLVNTQIKVYILGIKPTQVPKNIVVQHFEVIPDKLQYFKLLSKSWIGINIGVHRGGTNQRKYDYAMAGLFVLSDGLGSRGDWLPRESTFIDSYDLAAKLEQLLKFGKEELEEMGAENRKTVLALAEKQRKDLLNTINTMVSRNS
jgi:hypothetical protein